MLKRALQDSLPLQMYPVVMRMVAESPDTDQLQIKAMDRIIIHGRQINPVRDQALTRKLRLPMVNVEVLNIINL